jgi:hypothetical protein
MRSRGENLPLVRFLPKRGADASYSLWAAVWRDDAVLCRDLLAASAARSQGPWRDADLLRRGCNG